MQPEDRNESFFNFFNDQHFSTQVLIQRQIEKSTKVFAFSVKKL